MKRTNEPTMEDAYEAISNAVKEEEKKLQKYPKIINYDEFLDKLSKEGYCLCGPLDANEIRIKNSRNGYLAGTIIKEYQRVISEKRDSVFEGILNEYTEVKQDFMKNPRRIGSYKELNERIDKITEDIWHKETWEEECFKLIAEFYKGYKSEKELDEDIEKVNIL